MLSCNPFRTQAKKKKNLLSQEYCVSVVLRSKFLLNQPPILVVSKKPVFLMNFLGGDRKGGKSHKTHCKTYLQSCFDSVMPSSFVNKQC